MVGKESLFSILEENSLQQPTKLSRLLPSNFLSDLISCLFPRLLHSAAGHTLLLFLPQASSIEPQVSFTMPYATVFRRCPHC